MMRLGMINDYTEGSFAQNKELGLSCIEFCVNAGADVEKFLASVPDIKRYSEQYGVAVASIGRWGADRVNANGVIEEELQLSYRYIDACAALSCPVFVCGCNEVEGLSFYQNCALAIEYLGRVIDYARGKGVKVAVYNCTKNNFVRKDPVWDIVLGQLPELGIKYDPSHCRYDGGNYLAEMKKWGRRFYHVHLKGSLIIDGERFDDPPAGMDQTDWGAFFSILYAYGYDGALSIEPHSQNWQGELSEAGIRYTIAYMNKLLF